MKRRAVTKSPTGTASKPPMDTAANLPMDTRPLLLHLQQARQKELKSRLELEKALAELRASTEAVRSLQDQLQVVCAWTHRIRLEGSWVTFDEFLTHKLNLKLSHGISPEAFEQLKQELTRNTPP